MSATEAHLAKRDRFLAAFRALAPRHAELRAVALYYAALHVVSSVAFEGGLTFPSHRQLNTWVKFEHPEAWEHYGALFHASIEARYHPGQFRLAAADVEAILEHVHWRAVLNWAEQRG